MNEKDLKSDDGKEKQIQFMTLYNGCHVRLSRFCRAVCRNNEDAKDLLSETVLRAYEHFETLRKPESFLSFLFGIASRIHRKKIRRLKFSGIFSQEQAERRIDHSANPEQKLEVVLLFEAMNKLPAAQQEALALFEISGLSLKEIQEIQQCSLSAVKARIARARQKLAMMLHVKDAEMPSNVEKVSTMVTDKLKIMTVNFF